ncbi:MAG: helix-turn-helix transcriptional regulator [Lachnospiraceae bacterium]|nr:helix-turn-helix transcriptional regulator [Lachnospiraceae bacterium]
MQLGDEMRRKAIGNRIFTARKNAHLSQLKLAEMVGMSSNSISNIELGKQMCNSDKLQRIADATGVSLTFIMNGSDSLEDELDAKLLIQWKKLNRTEKRKFIACLTAYNQTA